MSYQQITLIGRLGRDPEMRYTPTGKAVTDFSLAVDDGFGENKKTMWFKVTTWDKGAESAKQYLTKGSQVFIQGHLQHDNGNPRVWTGKDGKTGTSFEVTATVVRFLGAKSADHQPEAETGDIPF